MAMKRGAKVKKNAGTTQGEQYTTKDSGKRESFGTGAIRDSRLGKGRYDLISPIAMRRIAGVYERGAVKYGDDRNWERGMPISRMLDSTIRHVFQYLEGMRDEDHLAQAAWNLLAAIHTEECVNRGRLPQELLDTQDYTASDG